MAKALDNSQTILRQIVEEQRLSRDPDSTYEVFFEFFVPKLLLRERGLSDEQVDTGVIGSGGDGGIDFIYLFIDDILVDDSFDVSLVKKNSRIEFHIGQAKTSPAYREEAINKLIAVTTDLLSLNVTEDEFSDVYSEDARSEFARFREIYKALLVKTPSLNIIYSYATTRPANSVSQGILSRANALEAECKKRFSTASVAVNLLGAAELWEAFSQQPAQVRTLSAQRVSSGKSGYICLVALHELDSFLRDSQEIVSQSIFDDNVRDWQGQTPVNAKISKTLDSSKSFDFWWLNNGVTVLCDTYALDDDILTLTSPQVVNGLQTCKEISQYFDRSGKTEDKRSVLVKVIKVDDEKTRDSIIQATNSQNSVSVAMLRATDPFQRKIEQFLLNKEYYYERRKNFYSNQGRAKKKIFSVTYMAQSVLATALFRPDDARARPSTPLKKDDEYKLVFSDEHPLGLYYNAAVLVREIENFLKTVKKESAKSTNNLRFYMAMMVVWFINGDAASTAKSVASIDLSEDHLDHIENSYAIIKKRYDPAPDQETLVKGRELKLELRDDVSAILDDGE